MTNQLTLLSCYDYVMAWWLYMADVISDRGIPYPHDISLIQCYMDITEQSTWAENSEHANGSGHVHLVYLWKNVI